MEQGDNQGRMRIVHHPGLNFEDSPIQREREKGLGFISTNTVCTEEKILLGLHLWEIKGKVSDLQNKLGTVNPRL